MRLTQNSQRNKLYLALAFIIPFAGLLLLRLFCTLTFNGTYSMLYSDQYHQYYPFFVEFRQVLRSGGSLTYNWSTGMGMDYLGLISYYLASPLNLFSVIIPDGWVLGYFSLLMPLKLGFAGWFFALFLKKVFRKNDFSISIFGAFYALCAWALGYQWNIMWLDTFALLPLVALGTISLLRDRKFVLYTVTLFLSVFSNYYIGFFTCIFVLLFFICYEICRCKSIYRLATDLLWIAGFSILAIGMTAVLELPALSALQATQSSVNKFPTEFRLNISKEHTWQGLLEAMRQVASNANGGITPTFKEGLPNLYCGVLTNILAFLYLTCKRVKVRDRVCSVVMLLFFNASFIIRQLDYIWHGFHFTNMIPYRFSFLYSFVLLYMAYGAWTNRRHIRLWQVCTAGALSLGLALCNHQFGNFSDLISGKIPLLDWSVSQNVVKNLETIISNSTYAIFNGLLLIIYLCILFCSVPYKFNRGSVITLPRDTRNRYVRRFQLRRNITGGLMCGVMVFELILSLINFGVAFPGTNIVNYPKGKQDTTNVVSYMHEQERDTLFYRTETTHSQTLNDGALNDYNGISTFTSSANVRVTEFMQALGYGAKNTYNRYCFEESSPVANLFLGIKYMIERDGKVEANPYFDDVYASGDVHLLKNNTYLPLGFLANSQLVNAEFATDVRRFEFQNDLMRKASGISEDVWYSLGGNNLIISGSNATLSSQMSSGYCTYSTEGTTGKIEYSYTANRSGFMCINLDLPKRNNYSVWLNGKELYSETHSLPQMIAVSQVEPGDVVDIKLTCKANEKSSMNISAGILDEVLFRECYDRLSASTLQLTAFDDTEITGTIDCNRDGVLYTSIPQDGNWVAYVDGKPTNIVLIGEAMCGLLLTEGTHEVTFRYENKSFTVGVIVSIVCLGIFIAAYILVYKPKLRKKKGKFQK